MPDDVELSKNLRRHVETLAGLIGPRHLGRPSSNEATLAYIEREIGEPLRHESYDTFAGRATNLILERFGTKRPGEIVILGAHHDTEPETPGADDNASAVAVLIEVAKLTRGIDTKRTIRFVAFANEEPPHFFTDSMGSAVHAKGCYERKENVVAMLCLEMVGYFTDAPNSQRVPVQIPKLLRKVFPTRGNFLAAVGNLNSIRLGWTFRRGFKRASKLSLFSVALPESINEIRLSDNLSFWEIGVPALMLTDTSFLRNPNYHRDTDRPETLDYAKMAMVARGTAAGLLRVAGGR